MFSWTLLQPGTVEPLLAVAGDFLSGAELAWRQFGRYFGPGTKLSAAALWILRRSHCRHIRGLLFNGRACAVGIHTSGNCIWVARRFPDALDRGLPYNIHSGPIPTFILEVRANRNTAVAGRRKRGAILLVQCEINGRAVESDGCWRRNWHCRNVSDAGHLGDEAYGEALPRGKSFMSGKTSRRGLQFVPGCLRRQRLVKFAMVGGIGVVVQIAVLKALV